MLLLAGRPKAGKSYAAAAASASPLIGRTLWVPIGEDAPDELGAVTGARFEIVEHDGTYESIVQVLAACVAELQNDKKPGMIVVDSMTRLWQMLTDEAQHTANHRASRRGRGGAEDAPISMDLWNRAKKRWDAAYGILRTHQGPVLLTARLEQTAVVNDRGEPTKDKDWKIQAHKSLPWDVGAIVEMPEPGKALLTGCRSARMPVPVGEKRELPDFTIEKLWTAMGLNEGASQRRHTGLDAEQSVQADEATANDPEVLAARSSLWDVWSGQGRGDGDTLTAAIRERFNGLPIAAMNAEQFLTFRAELLEERGSPDPGRDDTAPNEG